MEPVSTKEAPRREGTDLVHDVEVSVVLFSHQPSQQFLLRCSITISGAVPKGWKPLHSREIVVISHLNSSLAQHPHTLTKVQHESVFSVFQRFEAVLRVDGGKFSYTCAVLVILQRFG